LANDDEAESHDDEHSHSEGESEDGEADHSRGRTLAERVHNVLEELEANLHESLENLKVNEIAAAWELAGWLASSAAEVEFLV